MKNEWTQHRFSGGALALDLVNTVVRSSEGTSVFDRLANAADAARFAEAAAKFRLDERDPPFCFPPAPEEDFARLLELRERIYTHFAPAPENSAARLAALSRLMCASGRALAETGPDSLLCQTVLSWMRLNAPEKRARLRACPACFWLFLDRSRNGSRVWCDMAVCGNRHKSRLNYNKRRRPLGMEARAA